MVWFVGMVNEGESQIEEVALSHFYQIANEGDRVGTVQE